MPVHFLAATPVLVVHAIEPTRSFFCDRLGFIASTEIVHDGLLAFVQLEREGAKIIVESQARRDDQFGARNGHAPLLAPDGNAPLASVIAIDVDDVTALIAEIADTDIVFPLRRNADGRQEICVREPGGNLIVFTS
jgi:hypothetical protein